MTKPVIVTRANKGAPLTRTELDANFTNLDNATWSVTDGTNSKAFSLNDSLQFTAGTNISLSVNSTTGAVTINNTLNNTGTVTSVAALTLGTSGTDVSSTVATGTTTPVITLNIPTASATNRGVLSSTDWSTFNSKGSGTVTSVGGTGTVSGLTLTGTVTSTGSLTLGGTLSLVSPGAIGSTTPSTGAFTTLSASSTVSGTGFSTYLASPPAIGGTAAAAGAFTTLSASSTVSGTGFSTYLASPPAIGGTTASTGRFTTVTSTIATGTAPFTVASTTNVANLNASSLNGATFAAPGAIGSTTASTGAFTTISASTTGTSGAVNVTYTPATAAGAAIQTTGKDSQGGTGFFDFFKATNTTTGVTNGSKTMRLNATGGLEIVNNAYTGIILTLTDAGVLTVPSISVTSATTLKDLRETVYTAGSTTGIITPDVANGTVQKITLTGSITFNAFANPVAGQSLTLIITQSASGGLTLTSSMKFAGASKTLSTAANAVDILTVFYDGSTYWASLGKGFA